jgi:hypothetical protein
MKYLVLLGIFFSFSSMAAEVKYLMRSPRALLMGDAYTSLGDDAYALFYNPASLARHDGFTMTLFDTGLSVTDILEDKDKFSNLPSDPVGATQELLNFPVHLGSSLVSGFKIFNFSFTSYVVSNTNLMLSDATRPVMDVDYRLDRGFMLGYAFPLGSSRLSKDGNGKQLSAGLTLRYLKRKTVDGVYPMFGSDLLGILDGSIEGVSEFMDRLGPATGNSWGYDLGVEYISRNGSSELTFGMSILDVMGTKFSSADASNPVEKQDMTVNIGTAWKQDFGVTSFTLAADYHPVLETIDWQRKLHIGAELYFTGISLLAGYNGGYLSYGVGVDLWFMELYAGFYGVELGNDYREKRGKRGIIFLDLAEFHFDF